MKVEIPDDVDEMIDEMIADIKEFEENEHKFEEAERRRLAVREARKATHGITANDIVIPKKVCRG